MIVKQPSSAGRAGNDTQINTNKFKEKLSPSDIKLSSAMAMSAAAVSPYFGRHKELERQTTHILTLLGFEMGANVVYDMKGERKENCGSVRFKLCDTYSNKVCIHAQTAMVFWLSIYVSVTKATVRPVRDN